MSIEIACSNCRCPGKLPDGRMVTMERPMELIDQFRVQGRPTFRFNCGGCNGKAEIQHTIDPRTGRPARNPHTGEVLYHQIRLTGNHNEFRPNSIKPKEQIQVPVAYTLGESAATRHRVPVAPLPQIPVAFSLDPRINADTQIQGNDPMHPNNIRNRIQAWTLDQLT